MAIRCGLCFESILPCEPVSEVSVDGKPIHSECKIDMPTLHDPPEGYKWVDGFKGFAYFPLRVRRSWARPLTSLPSTGE